MPVASASMLIPTKKLSQVFGHSRKTTNNGDTANKLETQQPPGEEPTLRKTLSNIFDFGSSSLRSTANSLHTKNEAIVSGKSSPPPKSSLRNRFGSLRGGRLRVVHQDQSISTSSNSQYVRALARVDDSSLDSISIPTGDLEINMLTYLDNEQPEPEDCLPKVHATTNINMCLTTKSPVDCVIGPYETRPCSPPGTSNASPATSATTCASALPFELSAVSSTVLSFESPGLSLTAPPTTFEDMNLPEHCFRKDRGLIKRRPRQIVSTLLTRQIEPGLASVLRFRTQGFRLAMNFRSRTAALAKRTKSKSCESSWFSRPLRKTFIRHRKAKKSNESQRSSSRPRMQRQESTASNATTDSIAITTTRNPIGEEILNHIATHHRAPSIHCVSAEEELHNVLEESKTIADLRGIQEQGDVFVARRSTESQFSEIRAISPALTSESGTRDDCEDNHDGEVIALASDPELKDIYLDTDTSNDGSSPAANRVMTLSDELRDLHIQDDLKDPEDLGDEVRKHQNVEGNHKSFLSNIKVTETSTKTSVEQGISQEQQPIVLESTIAGGATLGATTFDHFPSTPVSGQVDQQQGTPQNSSRARRESRIPLPISKSSGSTHGPKTPPDRHNWSPTKAERGSPFARNRKSCR